VIAVPIVAAAAIVAVLAVILPRGGGVPKATKPRLVISGNSAARLNAGKLAAVVPLAGAPTAIASGEGAIWVAEQGGTISRIDPRTNDVCTILVGGEPSAIAVGGGMVWVVDRAGGVLIPIDAQTNAVGASIELARGVSSVAIGDGAVWVAGKMRSRGPGGIVYRIDPLTRKVLGLANLRGGSAAAFSVAVGDGAVWVASEGVTVEIGGGDGLPLGSSGSILAASLAALPSSFLGQRVTSAPTEMMRIELIPYAHGTIWSGPPPPAPIAAGEGSVWVALPATRTLYRTDPATDQVVGRVAIRPGPTGIAVAGGHVWISFSDGMASEVDAANVRVVATIRVGGAPQGIAIATNGDPWIAAQKA
jgi:DNA-binding beta-propeller fold protein YncE